MFLTGIRDHLNLKFLCQSFVQQSSTICAVLVPLFVLGLFCLGLLYPRVITIPARNRLPELWHVSVAITHAKSFLDCKFAQQVQEIHACSTSSKKIVQNPPSNLTLHPILEPFSPTFSPPPIFQTSTTTHNQPGQWKIQKNRLLRRNPSPFLRYSVCALRGPAQVPLRRTPSGGQKASRSLLTTALIALRELGRYSN